MCSYGLTVDDIKDHIMLLNICVNLELTFPDQGGQQALHRKQWGERRDGHGMFCLHFSLPRILALSHRSRFKILHLHLLNYITLQAVAARKIGKEIRVLI